MSSGSGDSTSVASEDLFNAQVDGFFQIIIKATNRKSIPQPVTVSTGGLLVSGELVSMAEYFDHVWKMPNVAEELRESAREEEEHGQELDEDMPAFYHLKNARVFHPSGVPIPRDQPIWWRGKIAAVDGFFLGVLSEQVMT